MTSSMLSGDRRWASARRGAMTVLGKVPKPINLPSQRLENHGMDPSVEIVPKGTLSWGSRSSSASNAWGTSSLSPNTDGGTTSPSYLSGHISSGSGTRPSTAGSEKSHEPAASAWGPNSRPSSASGVLTSNQTSLASLRPRSAEPRPGSSQLSRFAEHSEHPVAWNAPGTAEKLGVTSSKNEGFSLTSGDFPTLGSEKDNSGKNAESQDHSAYSRPGSSSGGGVAKETTGTSVVGDISVNASVKSGTGNSWKRENPSYNEDGGRPGMEKWQGNPQPYPGASVPPQHYDAWHGGPVHPQGGPVPHPQGGVWFRGPPGGPPFGAQVPPGGFPMEPFPYYPPQIPAAALANPQPVPPTGAGPRGHHPKNGEMYRPHMPEAYIRPGMPIRPGFYPGPVAFEGYYGSPMGYCNSNERDVPFVGMPAGPPVYNRYPSQSAPEPGRPSGYGPTSQTGLPEKIASGHPHDTRGPYKVLLKQHDGWDRRNEEQRSEVAVTTNASCLESEDQPRALSLENDWRSDRRKEGERDRRSERPASQNSDRGASSARVKVKSPESLGNMRAADAIPVKKLETEACGTQDIAQTLSAKDPSLIQKIEGLNAKARVSDGRGDTASVSIREEQRKTFQVNPKSNSSVNETGSGSATEIINSSHEVSSGISVSRGPAHGMHGKSDNRGRGRFNNQEGDGWGKKSLVSEPTSVVSTANSKVPSNVHVHDHLASMEATEKSGSYPQGRREDDSLTPMFDPNDSEAQRAKMKELAKQRTKQLQEEEEERTRRQMAKARAKLEELNRRTQVVDGSNQKFENSSSGDVQSKQEESQTSGEPLVAGRKYDPQVPAFGSNLNAVEQIKECISVEVAESTVPSIELPSERPKSAYKEEPIFMHDQPVPLQQQVTIANTAHHNTASQAHDNSISRQKQAPKQKQNTRLEKKSIGKNTSTSMTDTPNSQTDTVVNVSSSGGVGATSTALSTESSLTANSGGVGATSTALSTESSLTANSSAILESSSHPRKKNNRSGKNKQRAENSSSVAAISSSISNDTNHANTTIETGKPNVPNVDLDPSSVQSQTFSRDAYQSMEQHLSLPNEESQGRLSGQWKPQHSRRMPRNSQAIRHSEKFQSSDAVMWAPVRSQNKTDVTDDATPKTEAEAVSAVKSDHQVQNNSRNKRAEMERYVPKPVAKEMAHQGSTQQAMVSVVHQTAINENIRGADSGPPQGVENSQPSAAVGKAGFAIESRNGSSRQNKQVKAHGSWRQRGSTEPTNTQGFHEEPSYTSNVGQSDIVSVTEQPKNSDDWNDGWNMPDEPNTVVPVSASIAVKEQGIPGRRKQHPFKGQKTVANNHDHEQKKNYRGDADRIYTKSSASEMSQTELPSASKENQAVGERAIPHWQPKSQAFAANNHRGNRATGPQGAEPLSPTTDKDTTEHLAQHRHDQYKSERNNAGEGQNRRERKTTHKGRPGSPSHGPVSPVELAPPSMDARQEHQFQTGFRRNGNQNNRFSRGQESRGDWNYSGHDGRQQNPPANRDRQRHSSHLEYQPVGPYNSSDKFNNSEGPREGAQNSGGGRVKERVQGHSKRSGGNFHGRQSGTIRVVPDME
ncbi:protein MODIFIER OF SNC1 1 isoform X1 [Rosa chinensis]|uniref:protein MODIFIER OF SNC1 1 isoform X1 n=1 Tax=Rosa chinensis TaxID=74649 RepID=UPI000D096487|nr:protein MODIFIER OF SNC1 1 isoform X1 [Rosa chinensis]XP_040366627.1 protein MODIFIER OF SNC1 1 isoform X1 [Rosa chinensis]